MSGVIVQDLGGRAGCTSIDSLFEQVLESVPDGVTIQDRDFNIIHQNAAMKRAFGDHIGAKCYAVYEHRDRVCEGCGLAKAFETGQPNLVHRTGVLEDGTLAHYENACSPLHDDEGNIIAGVELCRNVTDRVFLTQEVRERGVELGKLNDVLTRKQRELEDRTQELEQAYKDLQQTHLSILQQEKMACLGQLATDLAREISTPIQDFRKNLAFLQETFHRLVSEIQQWHRLLELGSEDSTEHSQPHEQLVLLLERLNLTHLQKEVPLVLGQTTEGAQRITAIISALQEFADSDGTSLVPVALNDVIHWTLELSRNTWEQVADVTLDLAYPPLVVNGQKGGLGQVLLSLILNAVDAIESDPLSTGERGRISIQTRRDGNWAEILLQDSGCGIQPSLLGRIFEPFSTNKEVERGSAQGLAIAYSIITQTHGGELLVDSKPGEGSTFTVRIPLSQHSVSRERFASCTSGGKSAHTS